MRGVRTANEAEETRGTADRPMRRFASIVITEAPDSETARSAVARALDSSLGTMWISDPCPVGPAEDYCVIEIRLTVDGEFAIAAPLSPAPENSGG